MAMYTEEHEAGTADGMLTCLSMSVWSSSDGYSSTPPDVVMSPFLRRGRTYEFIPNNMNIDQPYPFQLHNTWFLAVKRHAGHIDFLAIT